MWSNFILPDTFGKDSCLLEREDLGGLSMSSGCCMDGPNTHEEGSSGASQGPRYQSWTSWERYSGGTSGVWALGANQL